MLFVTGQPTASQFASVCFLYFQLAFQLEQNIYGTLLSSLLCYRAIAVTESVAANEVQPVGCTTFVYSTAFAAGKSKQQQHNKHNRLFDHTRLSLIGRASGCLLEDRLHPSNQIIEERRHVFV